MMKRDCDVAVVGAGLAGLRAARALDGAGVDAVVVEARQRVGGRTLSASLGGVTVDHGAQWAGPTQDRVLELATELGVTTFPTHTDGAQLQLSGSHLSRFDGVVPDGSAADAADLMEALLELTADAMTVDTDAPWTHPNADRLDGFTVEGWLATRNWSAAAAEWVRLMVRAVFAAEPREVSLLHVLFYVRAAGGLEPLIGTAGGAQETRFVGGTQQLALGMAGDLGDRVVLGAPARRIEHADAGVVLHHDRGTVRARRVIVAVPPALAGRISYDPPLPGLRDQLTQRMWMGSVIKVHAAYTEPFWRADGLSGQASADSGIVRVTFDNSPHHAAVGMLVGFIEADEARSWGGRPADERREAVLARLVELFGPRAGCPELFVEHSWMDEEFTRGCYAGVMAPGTWVSYGPALRAPIGRLHWAGTETATSWCGYMEGALQSGERAAAEVLAALLERV